MPGSDDDECDGSGDSGKRGDADDDEDESGVYFFSMLFLDEICFS